jgi:uncharacterized protein YdaU (DUF1376 family)
MNYYKFHIGDYAVDTSHLSMIEDGAYRRLLDRYYTTEKQLPSDEILLFRVLRAREEQEKEAIRAVLKEFFSLSEGGWDHKRCNEEITAFQAKAGANKENGKLGGRPKKPTDNPDGFVKKPTDNPRITLTTNHKPLTTNQEPKEKKKDTRFDARLFLSKEGVLDQHISDWLKIRKEKKLPVTLTSLQSICRESTKANYTVSEAIMKCCEEGWGGFKAAWIENGKPQQKKGEWI